MKTLLLFISAMCAAALSACASSSSSESSAAPSPDATHSSQVWRLNHELTAQWRESHPQVHLTEVEKDPRRSSGMSSGFSVQAPWNVRDTILKLAEDGTFEAHFVLDEGGLFSVSGEWLRESVADGVLIDLNPSPTSQRLRSHFSTYDFTDSCILLIDDSNHRMRLMAIGQPDIILTRVP
ncbi:MAG: hypothetical protein ACNA8P_05055 [Phycisphaerales bacterium]